MAGHRQEEYHLRQLWCGNIPEQLSEPEVLAELAAYGVRPYKMRLRCRGAGQES